MGYLPKFTFDFARLIKVILTYLHLLLTGPKVMTRVVNIWLDNSSHYNFSH